MYHALHICISMRCRLKNMGESFRLRMERRVSMYLDQEKI